MRIIFAGSPAFAVPSLEELLASEHQVIGVIDIQIIFCIIGISDTVIIPQFFFNVYKIFDPVTYDFNRIIP